MGKEISVDRPENYTCRELRAATWLEQGAASGWVARHVARTSEVACQWHLGGPEVGWSKGLIYTSFSSEFGLNRLSLH
jgi:hypothetical protein